MKYEPYAPRDAEALVSFLTGETWPFHSQPVLRSKAVRDRHDRGDYDGEDVRTFWMVLGSERVGLIVLDDLNDPTAMFDLRIAAAHRGQGHGTAAVAWLTTYLFTSRRDVGRVEAVTRQDNAAMRAAMRRCGYAKESHYREAWPGSAGTVHDSVGYAITRTDWDSGTVTYPDWNDDPADAPS